LSCLRARQMVQESRGDAASAIKLADAFCQGATLKVNRLFHELWTNTDDLKYQTGVSALDGDFSWVENGIIRMDECDPEKIFGARGPIEQEQPASVK